MRILFAHNRYLHRGGEDESRNQEILMLRARGHEVAEYVVDNRDVKQSSLVTVGVRSVWNEQQARLIQKAISDTQSEILKVDNHFPILSPSIFAAAKNAGAATVLSVRNYRLVCPSANLFRDGKDCTDCVGKSVAYPAVLHRCYRRSYLQSSSVVLSNAYARTRGTWVHSVDQYVAVSEFVKSVLVSGGFPVDKINVKPNFIGDSGPGDGSGKYALYVGRLTEEKGVSVLIDAWRKIGNRIPLKVIGVGPLEPLLKRASEDIPGIELLGWKSIEDVCAYLGNASVLVFPSQWLEPFGRSIVEAYSKGTPVIAADTPPMRDMVEDGVTGFLFKQGDGNDLAKSLFALTTDSSAYANMRVSARARYLSSFSEERNYSMLMYIFEKALSLNGKHPASHQLS